MLDEETFDRQTRLFFISSDNADKISSGAFLNFLGKNLHDPPIKSFFHNSQPSKGIFNDFIKVVEVCEEFAQNPSMDLIQKFNEISRDFYSRLQGIISVTGKSEQYLASLRKVDQTY